MISSGKARIKLPARASFWYVASSALAKGVGVIGTPIFTRLLSPEAYGLYPLYTTWLSVFTIFATLELTGSVITKGMQRSLGREKRFLLSSLCLILFVFGVFCAAYFFFRGFFNALTGLSTPIFLCMLGQILSTAIIGLYSASAKYFYDYKTTAAIGITLALSSPVISIAIILNTALDAQARIIGSLVSSAVIALPLLINIVKEALSCPGTLKEALSDIRYLLTFNLPLLPHYLSIATIIRVGEITVGKFYGTEALGKYSVAMSLGLSLNMITGGLSGALSPWIMRSLGRGESERIKRILSLCAESLSIVCLFILCFAPETIRFITPKEYHDCLLAVYPLALSVLPSFICSALLFAQMYFEHTRSSSVPTVISALCCAILSLLILPRTDYRVASVFVFISYTAMAYMNIRALKRISSLCIISYSALSKILLFSCAYATAFALLKEYFLLRIIIFIPLLPTAAKGIAALYREIRE